MNYRFYKNRRIYFGISIGIILIGLASSLISGIKLDIQFQGGSVVRYTYEGTVDADTLTADVQEAIGADISSIQLNYNEASGIRSIAINVAGREALSVTQTAAIRTLLTATDSAYTANKFAFYEATLVNPSIGAEYLRRGIYALLLASVLIILYVWYSFRVMSGPSAGIMALVALFHDVAMVFVAFVLLKIPLNENLIAVVLTIIGYSINDTIVIYDRIRENLKLENGRMPLPDLVDKSINQSMTRTLNTFLATLGAMLITYIFASIYGIESIQNFTLPMMVGIVTGFYSTVFIASPLWVVWKTRGGRSGY
ncbi:MAG: protein translocase subunit SecF [Saccharofermentanales bacterium]